jgi:AcrR family transcriptional regulator
LTNEQIRHKVTGMTAAALHHRAESDTRARIVATAERFFREIGYQKTTVADIAKALRMSPANIYRFFDSKKAINEAVAERLMREVEGEIEAIITGPGSAVDRLVAAIEAMHRLNEERYVAHLRMHEMVEVAICESWDVIHGHIERTTTQFERLIEEGRQAGTFDVAEPRSSAYCLKCAMMRFFHPQLIAQCANEPSPTLPEMIRFVLSALGHKTA